jgi:putative ABC transport system permease protein
VTVSTRIPLLSPKEHIRPDQSSFSQRLGLYLTGAFATMAVLMVIAGLYGVLSQLTGYRRREFGIRLALGATPAGILWMVLRQALVFVAGGLAFGLGLALAGRGFLKSFLYGVQRVSACGSPSKNSRMRKRA